MKKVRSWWFVAALLLLANAPATAGLLPAVTHPVRHPKRDAKAVGHATKKTLKGIGKAIWYL